MKLAQEIVIRGHTFVLSKLKNVLMAAGYDFDNFILMRLDISISLSIYLSWNCYLQICDTEFQDAWMKYA